MINLPSRQKKILKKLLSFDGWIKGKELSEEMEVTLRTIRTDINAINHAIQSKNCYIESSRQEGYRFNGNLSKEIEQMLFEGKSVPNTPEERIRVLGIRLLWADETDPEDLEELEEEMFISGTTLESYIFKIKMMLESRTTPIYVKRKNKKVWTFGEEETRRFLLKELMVDRTEPDYIMLENYADYFGSEVPEKIMSCVLKALAENDLSMTTEDILHLVIFLAIKITRIYLGYEFQENTEQIQHDKDLNWKISMSIVRNIESKFSITLNETEQVDLMVQISLMRLIVGETKAKQKIKTSQSHYEYIVDDLLKDIKDKFQLDLTNDWELKEGLVTHIRYMLKRIQIEPQAVNPVLALLKTEYPFVFDMSLFLYERFYDEFGVRLNENELGYVATYLGSAIERMEKSQSSSDFTIALVTSLNYGTSCLLLTRLRSIYGEQCHIEGPFSGYELDQIKKIDPAFIVTTESKQILKDLDTSQIKISPLLNEHDQRSINKKIMHLRKESLYGHLPKDIKDYFNENLFFKNLKAETTKEVIETMSEKLVEFGFAGEDFVKKTLEREELAPTNFGNKIAMPHPIEACAKKTVIGIATLENPIQWGAGKAQMIFLLAIKKEDMKYLNSFFELTVRLVDDSDLVKKLLATESLTQFKNCLPM